MNCSEWPRRQQIGNMKQIKKEKSLKDIGSVDRYLSTVGIAEEKEFFLENLSMLIGSGITITSAIESIKNETRSKGMRMILASLIEDLDGGEPLWRAIKNTHLLDDNSISLIKLGEESGQLPENLNIIILRQRKDRSFKSKIRSAMMYPVFVLVLAFVIGVGISWFMLPRLAKVFADLKLNLPLMTRILISFGKFIEANGKIAIPAAIFVLIVLVFFMFIYSRTKFIGEWMLFQISGARKVIQGIELSRFGYIMGTLLKAGLPMTGALEALTTSSGFSIYHKMYKHLQKSIAEGNSFQKSFAAFPKINKLIPAPQQHMIVAAERSAKLEETFYRIGEIYEEKTDQATKNMTVLLEPVMLVIVWLAVVFVALAVILPIYSLVGGLNNGSSPGGAQPVQEQQVQSDPSMETNNLIQIEDASSATDATTETAENQTGEEATDVRMVKILKTETGTLNVREEPSIKAKIVAKVKPDSAYELLEQSDEWNRIKISDEQTGWINKAYSEIIQTNENEVEENDTQ